MATVHRAVAIPAKEAAAFLARNNGAAFRMIKTTGFAFLFQSFWGGVIFKAIDRGEDMRINQLGAIFAIAALRIVPRMDFNGPLAGGATDVPHGFL